MPIVCAFDGRVAASQEALADAQPGGLGERDPVAIVDRRRPRRASTSAAEDALLRQPVGSPPGGSSTSWQHSKYGEAVTIDATLSCPSAVAAGRSISTPTRSSSPSSSVSILVSTHTVSMIASVDREHRLGHAVLDHDRSGVVAGATVADGALAALAAPAGGVRRAHRSRRSPAAVAPSDETSSSGRAEHEVPPRRAEAPTERSAASVHGDAGAASNQLSVQQQLLQPARRDRQPDQRRAPAGTRRGAGCPADLRRG